jgi:hypothetical protein
MVPCKDRNCTLVTGKYALKTEMLMYAAQVITGTSACPSEVAAMHYQSYEITI